MKIKEMAPEDRPIEKMIEKGIQSLSDAELLAILIRSGSTRQTAVELSREIMKDTGNNLHQLGKLSVKELTARYHGIGLTKAVAIVAALELGKRRNQSEVIKNFAVTSSRDIFRYFQPLLADTPHEEFWVVYLNQSNKIIHRRKISQGGVSETAVDIRIILKEALEHLASAVILCHNHPSGNNKPSAADDAFTRKVKEAARFMDIRVLDHIIVCEDCYFSYADEGKM